MSMKGAEKKKLQASFPENKGDGKKFPHTKGMMENKKFCGTFRIYVSLLNIVHQCIVGYS